MNKGWLVILLVFFYGCNKENTLFKSLDSATTGIDFTNTLHETDSLNILDYLYFYNGGGVAIGDFNNDGLPDIYLSANQQQNELYLNQGDFKFKDVSNQAGITGNNSWSTGVVVLDVNADGYLDIYQGAVVGINGFTGHNELYVNQGDGTFKEQAKAYGLDLQTFTSGMALLDYDLDGDLDIYVLNHAVHTQESFGRQSLREQRNAQTGDRLLRNDNGIFTDVSELAGIYGGVNSYGLGVSVADFNQDGWPDLYIGNDFHEDDYFYLNNQDGTFKESLRDYFGHTSRFSMGNDAADINNDGLPDLISLDMLSADEVVVKSSEGDDNMQTLSMRTQQFGYHYQFSRNMLYINKGDLGFAETALLSGVAATDWSWSSLFADFDLDGKQDLYIANGIPKRPNNLDFIRFVSSGQIQSQMGSSKLVNQQAFELMPNGAVANSIFKGDAQLGFQDMSGTWLVAKPSVSGASALADLDADGDLDLITTNINAPVSVLENTSLDQKNYLSLKLNFTPQNKLGIGTKVYLYQNGTLQFKELYTARGFQSSSQALVNFGLGDNPKIDSLQIIWPNGQVQVQQDVVANQTLTIQPKNTATYSYAKTKTTTPIFKLSASNMGLNYTHKEDNYLDFNRQKLIPYRVSSRGPAVAVADMTGDGKQDIVFGSAKFDTVVMYRQNDSMNGFKATKMEFPQPRREQVAAAVGDYDQDGFNDIFFGSGGADFYGQSQALLDQVFLSGAKQVGNPDIPESYFNTSVARTHDIDNDGDLDIFVGGHVVSNDFAKPADSYLLINNAGKMERQVPDALKGIGMVTDAVWSDFSGDGIKDLIVVGEWMSPLFFRVEQGRLVRDDKFQGSLNGLWQRILPFDVDGDGDLDYVLGNWGLNSKFKATPKHPLKMYYADFDNNDATETILAQYTQGNYYPLLSLDELSGQLVSLKKKYSAFKDFAGAPIEEVLGETIARATVLTVSHLESGYLENIGQSFIFKAFDTPLQLAPIKAMLAYDFTNNGKQELLFGGNYFGVIPFHGRLDAFGGAVLIPGQEPQVITNIGLQFLQKSLRHLHIIELNNTPYLLATFNNAKAEIYDLVNYK